MMRSLLLLTTIVSVAACSKPQSIDPSQQEGPNPVLPAPHEDLISAVGVPNTVPWHNATPHVPAGFSIQAFANGFTSPRNIYPLANGDVLVIESQHAGSEPTDRPKDPVRNFIMTKAHGGGGNKPVPERISVVRDTNGDGKADQKSVLIDNLNAPFGVVLVGNKLYVADTDAILAFAFTPGQTKITAKPRKVVDLPAGIIDHHWTKSLTASPDGSKLYVGVGSNSNIQERGPEAERDRAAIWEVDPKTGAYRIFASGLRNPNGLTFYPGTNTLWTVVNERDEIGPNLVPDYMTSVRDGAFYGWPYSYYGQHVDPRVRPQRPDMVEKAIPADYALGSHVAPLGLVFYEGAGFPLMFQGGAFVGEHGSWNRTSYNGYKVVFIRFAGGRPVDKPIDFVTQFLDGKGNMRGRPVGVAIDRTGALLIADDVGGTVWRVTSNASVTAIKSQSAGR